MTSVHKTNGHKFPVRYLVTVQKSKYGYHVECPALPGCVSQGETLSNALANIKDAIRTYLAMIRKEIHSRQIAEVVVNF